MRDRLPRSLLRIGRRIRRRLSRAPAGRDSVSAVLAAFRALTDAPAATVLDVGAAHGTPALYDAFPGAHFVLVEPLSEFHATLSTVAAQLPSAELVPYAAGASVGTAAFNVHPDLVGSSFYIEPADDERVNGVERNVEVTTLDVLSKTLGLQPPFFIKVDTQGFESDVIQGASEVLKTTQGVMLELSLFDFFEGSPRLASVLEQMSDLGFVLYDICDRRYRLLDGALAQFDALFVPDESPHRGSHRYASDEQRQRQTAQIRRTIRR